MTTPTATIVAAMRVLVHDIQSDDGVANAAIGEAADRLEELDAALAKAKARLERYRRCLMTTPSKVQRYSEAASGIIPDDDGELCSAFDYAALESDRDAWKERAERAERAEAVPQPSSHARLEIQSLRADIERLGAERNALRRRISEAPTRKAYKSVAAYDNLILRGSVGADPLPKEWHGKRVALVVLE